MIHACVRGGGRDAGPGADWLGAEFPGSHHVQVLGNPPLPALHPHTHVGKAGIGTCILLELSCFPGSHPEGEESREETEREQRRQSTCIRPVSSSLPLCSLYTNNSWYFYGGHVPRRFTQHLLILWTVLGHFSPCREEQTTAQRAEPAQGFQGYHANSRVPNSGLSDAKTMILTHTPACLLAKKSPEINTVSAKAP